MPRAQNAHALVNAGFLLELDTDGVVKSSRIVYGNINPKFIRAKNTEQLLDGKKIFDNSTLLKVFQSLDSEIKPDFTLGEPKPEFRKKLAISLFYKVQLYKYF